MKVASDNLNRKDWLTNTWRAPSGLPCICKPLHSGPCFSRGGRAVPHDDWNRERAEAAGTGTAYPAIAQ